MAFATRNIIEDAVTFIDTVPEIIMFSVPVSQAKQLLYISRNIQEYEFFFGSTAAPPAGGGETSHTWVG